MSINTTAKAQEMQDLIVLRNGQYIECTVTNAADEFIHYKRLSSEDKISVDLVKSILYADGSEKVIFEEQKVEEKKWGSTYSTSQKEKSSNTPTGLQGTITPPTKKQAATAPGPQYVSVRPYNPAFCGVMSLVIPGRWNVRA